MNLMVMIGVSVLALASFLIIFFSGYVLGRVNTMKQMMSIDNFVKLSKDINEVIGEKEE